MRHLGRLLGVLAIVAVPAAAVAWLYHTRGGAAQMPPRQPVPVGAPYSPPPFYAARL